jgi:hypothetical protein
VATARLGCILGKLSRKLNLTETRQRQTGNELKLGVDFLNAIALPAGEGSLPFIAEIRGNVALSGHNQVRFNRFLTRFKSTFNKFFPFLVYNGMVAPIALWFNSVLYS